MTHPKLTEEEMQKIQAAASADADQLIAEYGNLAQDVHELEQQLIETLLHVATTYSKQGHSPQDSMRIVIGATRMAASVLEQAHRFASTKVGS